MPLDNLSWYTLIVSHIQLLSSSRFEAKTFWTIQKSLSTNQNLGIEILSDTSNETFVMATVIQSFGRTNSRQNRDPPEESTSSELWLVHGSTKFSQNFFCCRKNLVNNWTNLLTFRTLNTNFSTTISNLPKRVAASQEKNWKSIDKGTLRNPLTLTLGESSNTT